MAYYTTNGTNTVRYDRLVDLGHDITPNWAGQTVPKLMNEVVQILLLSSLLVTPLIALLRTDLKYRPYLFHVGVRFMFCVTTGHILRPIFYLSTSLPGPAAHCIGAEEDMNQPHSAKEIFLEAVPGANCGDLVFSGHMLMVTTCWMMQYKYFGGMFGKNAQQLVLYGGALLMLLQAFIVCATRSHYTVDVTGGIIVALFNYMWHETYLRPKDFHPEDKETLTLASAATPFLEACVNPAVIYDNSTSDRRTSSEDIELAKAAAK
jgi:hypothetical protein